MSDWMRGVGVAILLLASMGSTARGESNAAGGNDGSPWEVDLSFYTWLADVTGDAEVGDVKVDIEPQLWNDILRNVDIALFGAAEVRYRSRWIANVDVALIRLSTDSEKGPYSASFGPASFTRRLDVVDTRIAVDTPAGSLEVPVRVNPGVLRVDVPRVETVLGPFDIDTRMTTLTTRALLGYRALDRPLADVLGWEAPDDPRRVRVDLLAGLRYYYSKTEIDIEGPPIRVPPVTVTSSISGGRVRVGGERLPPRTMALGRVDLPDVAFSGVTLAGTDVEVEESDWWIDPVVGLRVGADLSEAVSIALSGNVGGFGIGSASTFSWETILLARYRLGEQWSLIGGYRALGYERTSGDMTLDLIQHGPALGLVYRF